MNTPTRVVPYDEKLGMLEGLLMAKVRAVQIRDEVERQRVEKHTAEEHYLERHTCEACEAILAMVIEDIGKMVDRIAAKLKES